MIEQTRGEDDMELLAHGFRGFTECQLYRAYSSVGNLTWLKGFYPGLKMTKEDIVQIEGWIKDHPVRCLTVCKPRDIPREVTSGGST